MKTIHKYQITSEREIKMPKGAEILSFQSQKELPFIWALVDTKAPLESRYFDIFLTGHEVYDDMGIERKYIGTCQIDDGNLVFHLFERIN